MRFNEQCAIIENVSDNIIQYNGFQICIVGTERNNFL